MPPEPHFSRRGDDLYRTHWAHGTCVVERWAAGTWRAAPGLDFVMYETSAIPARTAIEMIKRSGGEAPPA